MRVGGVAAVALMVGVFAALARWLRVPAPTLALDRADPDDELVPARLGAREARVGAVAAGEYVAVTGQIVGEALLRAPLTGRRCVAYELRLRCGHDALAHEAAATAITLSDGTGMVRVDGTRAVVRLPRRDRFRNVGQTRRGRKLLGRLGLARNGVPYDGFEAVLLPGDRATAIGRVDAPSPAVADGPYRAASAVPRLVPGAEPLVITAARALA